MSSNCRERNVTICRSTSSSWNVSPGATARPRRLRNSKTANSIRRWNTYAIGLRSRRDRFAACGLAFALARRTPSRKPLFLGKDHQLMSKPILAALLGILLVTPLRASEEAAGQPQAYVLLVGIDKYADQAIKPRLHAEADAQALYDLFTSKGHLGVHGDHIRLLLGSEDKKRNSQPATHANVLKGLQWLADKAGKDDLVIFAFFGEGAPHGDQTCYLCSDSTIEGRAKDALITAEISHEIHRLKSQRFCALLDVNFKGFDGGKDAPAD